MDEELEDIHLNVEVLLHRYTEAAGKLHTARSRNDQVVCDFRLYCARRALRLARQSLGLEVATGMVDGAEFHSDKMLEACPDIGLYALDLADELVRRGVSFREAHQAVAEVMSRVYANAKSWPPGEAISSIDLKKIHEALSGIEFDAVCSPEASIARRVSPGAPSKQSLERLWARLEEARQEIEREIERLSAVEETEVPT